MTEKRVKAEPFDLARSMLILNQFEELCRLAEGICEVIPLKGIALLRTLYSERFDRAVGDIDLLISPADRLGDYIERLQKRGYTLQFDFMSNQATRARKGKVALRASVPHLTVDVDLHTAFVTKKFFSRSVERFNADALARCKSEGRSLRTMEPLDEWLFLAQHACFHQYSDPKWLRDLYLLAGAMSSEQWNALEVRARNYGFLRVLYLTSLQLHVAYADFHHPIPCLPSAALFSCFVAHYRAAHTHALWRKLTSLFWEFLFIDRLGDRLKALFSLLFPTPSLLRNIYRKNHWLQVLLLYPANLLLSLLAGLLFVPYFLLRTIR